MACSRRGFAMVPGRVVLWHRPKGRTEWENRGTFRDRAAAWGSLDPAPLGSFTALPVGVDPVDREDEDDKDTITLTYHVRNHL